MLYYRRVGKFIKKNEMDFFDKGYDIYKPNKRFKLKTWL